MSRSQMRRAPVQSKSAKKNTHQTSQTSAPITHQHKPHTSLIILAGVVLVMIWMVVAILVLAL